MVLVIVLLTAQIVTVIVYVAWQSLPSQNRAVAWGVLVVRKPQVEEWDV
jgi:hypothetical protein